MSKDLKNDLKNGTESVMSCHGHLAKMNYKCITAQ